MSLYVAKTITILERDFGRRLIRAALGKPPRKTRPPGAENRPDYGPGRTGRKPEEVPKDVEAQGERIRQAQALDRGTMAGSRRRRPGGRKGTPWRTGTPELARRMRAMGHKPAPSTPSFGKRVEKKAPATPSFGR